MVTSSTRKRAETYSYLPIKSTTWDGPSLIATNTYLASTGYSQTTMSHGNQISHLKSRRQKLYMRNREDIGGSFQTIKVDTRGKPTEVHCTNGPKTVGVWFRHDGVWFPWDRNQPRSISSAPTASTKAQMDAMGTQAIARSLPTNPLAGMGQFLGELRDLPKIPDVRRWQQRAAQFRHATKHVDFDKLGRDAADEYLNGVFGWVPFVSDLKKFAKVVKHSSSIMQIYARNSGRVLKRRYHFPTVSTTVPSVVSNSWYGDPALPTWCVAVPGKLYKDVRTLTEQWCSMAFVYYLPQVDPNDNEFTQSIYKWKLHEANASHLYGLRLTPDLLYKLTPWSWAVDWLTTTGDVIHNWSAFSNDGLVLKYAYMMEHKSIIETWNCVGLRTVDGQILDCSQARRSEIKTRTIGTPYGFGLNSAAFTAKQWAVIAALGISKQPLSINKG